MHMMGHFVTFGAFALLHVEQMTRIARYIRLAFPTVVSVVRGISFTHNQPEASPL